MSSDALPTHLEALLEHRDFVRTLARSLVRDSASAEDIAQETWISALTNPPHVLTSARGWLARVTRNHASNARREAARRTRREEIVARGERDDSGEALGEQLALQQRVAAAVLGLREPYRGVILLHYHAGLSADEIAKKRGVPSGTVRSQITRGLDILRTELDVEFGDRGTWCALLTPLAGSGKMFLRATSTKLAAAVLLVASGTLVAVAWRSNAGSFVPSTTSGLAPSNLPAIASNAAMIEPSSSPEASLRAAIVEQAHGGPSNEQLASHSTRELLALALHTQSELRARLLVPSAETRAQYAALVAEKDAGLARILERKRFDLGKPADALGLDGNGSYYSFTQRTNDYQRDASLKLEQNRLDPSRRGLILDLGPTAVAAPALISTGIPRELDVDQRAAWSLAWSDAHVTDRDYDRSFDERMAALQPHHSASAELNHTYLLRSFDPGFHDLLATFTLVEQDAYGFTFAWRILQRWDIHGRRRGFPTSRAPTWLPDAPSWLKAQSTEELLATLERIRATAQAPLFSIPDAVLSAQAARLVDGVTTLARILDGGDWQPLVSMRGAGAFYSFSTRSNDYDAEPDVEVQQGTFHSGFAGRDVGFVVDLGEVRLEDVGKGEAEMPRALSESQEAAWRFLWNAKTSQISADRPEKSFSQELRQKAEDLGAGPTPVEVGHTYIVRSNITGVHDIVGALTVLARDEAGFTLLAKTIVVLEQSVTEGRHALNGLPAFPR